MRYPTLRQIGESREVEKASKQWVSKASSVQEVRGHLSA